MHIYVASSWRNTYYPEVVQALRDAGHEVYDFIMELRKFGSKLEVLEPAPPFSIIFLWLLSFIGFLFSQVQLGIACIYLLEFLLKKIQALYPGYVKKRLS